MRAGWLLASAVLLVARPLAGQARDRRLVPDPAVRVRTLPNGLRVYIQRNDLPAHGTELRLVIRGGTLAEPEGRRGYMHLLSHLTADTAIVRRNESVYRVVTGDNARQLDSAVAVLASLAAGRPMDGGRVAAARAQAVAEFDQPIPAARRLDELAGRQRFPDSPARWNTLLGDRVDVASATAARVAAFHRRYYRPDRMAVVIVGDVDVGRAEALVRRHFGRIPAPASRAPLPRQRLGSGFAVVYTRDTMSRYPTVTFSFVHPWKPVTTESAYRKDLSTVIYANMITYRGLSIFLNPATCVRYATKFIERFHSRDLQTSNYGAFALPPFGFEDAIAAVARETHRMREHGFEASEFDSVKAASQRGYDRTTDDRAPRPSAARAEDLVSAFADGEPALGLPAQIELGRRLTPGITLEQVNAMNREMTTPNYLVVTMASPRQPVPVPSPARVREILDREWSAPIAPGRPPIQLCNSR